MQRVYGGRGTALRREGKIRNFPLLPDCRAEKKAIHRLWHAFFRFSAWFTNRRVTADHSGPTADPPIPSRSVFSIGYPGGIMRTAQHHRFAGFLIVMILSFLILGLGMVLAGTTL